MKFNVNRMGEQHQDVTSGWLASIVTVGEMRQIKALPVGGQVSFKRAFSGPVGYTRPLVVERVS